MDRQARVIEIAVLDRPRATPDRVSSDRSDAEPIGPDRGAGWTRQHRARGVGQGSRIRLRGKGPDGGETHERCDGCKAGAQGHGWLGVMSVRAIRYRAPSNG